MCAGLETKKCLNRRSEIKTAFRTAEVIAVGTELLGSTRIDTNSLFIATQLSSIGIELCAKVVAGDAPEPIADMCRQAMSRAHGVELTGVLGPTDFDLSLLVVVLLSRPTL